MGGGMPMGGGGNQAAMMKQLQKMQEDMVAAQQALETETVEVTTGGIVTVVISGHQRVQSITIKTEAIDTSDAEWATDLQDLLVIAVNDAIEKSQTMAAQRMESITGGLGNIPGLGGLLG
ncbi:MAG: YbaB/EbfC family nucleoid-associated protein [Anaerolinea sp.]|nr:YbaB/EbfC family nucleoid-associated protein [Anaerolinea sp.]